MAIRTRHSDRKITMDLTLRPAELAAVCRIVQGQLHRWDLTVQADDVVTVVNELLANVVDHVPGARCKLTLERKAYLLHVRVSDDHHATPAKQQPNVARTTGRGLALVDGLTHGCWSVLTASSGDGKEVHCLFDISQAAPPTKTVNSADIVHEVFRYGIAHPGRLADIIHYAPHACDHLAADGLCNRYCLAATVGSVVHSGDRLRLLDGVLCGRTTRWQPPPTESPLREQDCGLSRQKSLCRYGSNSASPPSETAHGSETGCTSGISSKPFPVPWNRRGTGTPGCPSPISRIPRCGTWFPQHRCGGTHVRRRMNRQQPPALIGLRRRQANGHGHRRPR